MGLCDERERQIDVFCVQTCAAAPAQARPSWVVNVGSISSFVGQAGTPVYTTSKHAIVGLTKSIALDYAALGVRCNCICPGITDTPLLRQHLAAAGDPRQALGRRLRRVPL